MPTTLVEVVYPSTSSFSGTSQLNLGPFPVPSVHRLLRLEVHGKFNLAGVLLGPSGILANVALWAVQWVPSGTSPSDCVTTADGDQWLIRQQIGAGDTHAVWAGSGVDGNSLTSWSTDGSWAGQLAINGDIDLYLSSRAPTGFSLENRNYFGSMRFWWV